jgi:hypothetical protein
MCETLGLCHDEDMTKPIVLLTLMLATPVVAQIPLVRLQSFVLPVGRCFDRTASYPDRDRVEPHLPTRACVTSVSGTLAFAEDGTLLAGGAPGPSPRASAEGAAKYGVLRAFEPLQSPLSVVLGPRGYEASFVVDETPEDPAGDTGRLIVRFALDRSGKPLPGTVSVSGLVVCTFAPVCREEDLEIGYDDAGPSR